MTNTMTTGMDYNKCDSDAWMINTSGKYTTTVLDYLVSDGIPENGAQKIIQNGATVLGYCPNPESDEPVSKTGIVIGKVQSGKTSNFIALTALAFDNGYDYVVVFGGTTKLLVQQNGQRIEEYFSGTPEVIVLNTTDHKEYLNAETINSFLDDGKKVIIVSLKKPKRINDLRNNIFLDEILANMPTLIIDDEGDEASLNTLVSKGKKSSTYLAIEKLKSTLKRHCFVSVTATPQANMLIDSMDILSPSFGVLVDPGTGYCGLDVFHSPDSKYIVKIPDSEVSLLDGMPESFKEALMMYFVGCGIFRSRSHKPSDKFSMLVHPSQLKVDHSIVKKKTEQLVKSWRDLASAPSDIAFSSLKKRIVKAYEDYKNSTVESIPDYDLVEKNALYAIKQCKIHLVNGDSVPKDADKLFDFNIYVGGSMLGRGLTIKGLAITYMIRTPKGKSTVDTTAQRARWFGYKRNYLDLCRVYAVGKIIKEFRDIREHENDLWETVRDARLQGADFKKITRVFVLSDDLKMTRSNVAKTKSYSFKNWNIQRNVCTESEYINSNMTILQEYYKTREAEFIKKTFGTEDGAPFLILENVEFDEVCTYITDRFIFPGESALNNNVISKLRILLSKENIDPRIDVIWMRYGRVSEHNIVDGAVKEYMVGRRPEDSEPAIYKGDRYEFVKKDVMQLQIHVLKDRNSDLISPALALYIPTEYIEKLTNLVIRG